MNINKKQKKITIITIISFLLVAVIFFLIWTLFPYNKKLLDNSIKNGVYQGFDESIATCRYTSDYSSLSNKFSLDKFLLRCSLNINSAIRIESYRKMDNIEIKEVSDLYFIDGTYYFYATNGIEVIENKFKYLKKFNDEISTSIYLTNNNNVTKEQIISSYLSSNKPKNLATFFASWK